MLRTQSSWQGQIDDVVVVVVTYTCAKKEKEKGRVKFLKKQEGPSLEFFLFLLTTLCNHQTLGIGPYLGSIPIGVFHKKPSQNHHFHLWIFLA